MRRRLHRVLVTALACLLTGGTLVGAPQSTRAEPVPSARRRPRGRAPVKAASSNRLRTGPGKPAAGLR